jgi:phosphatidate phosphatase APP1
MLVAVVGPLSAWADARVLLFPSVGTTTRVTVAGRVLKHASTGGTSPLSRNVRRLATSNWEGAAVEVRYAGKAVQVTSGHDGNFEATFEVKEKEKPFEVGIGSAQASATGAEPARALVDVIDPKAPFFVISDFDDTVAVTEVLDKKKLLEHSLLNDELSQPVVEGMPQFYDCLQADRAARPVFALVSGSPVQYVGRIDTFLKRHRFPNFGLYLRDLGPNTLSDYKQPIIRALLKAVPQKVVLVGDSGEHDPEVYAQMRTEFPDRVLAVYIRNAGHADDPARFKDMLLFKEPLEAARDAVGKHLADGHCVEAAFSPRDGGAP